jgi:hypothetical protein
MRAFTFGLTTLVALALFACDSGKDEERANRFKFSAPSCETDKNCIDGFICKEKKCHKGKRTAAELAAQRKAKADAKREKEAAKKRVKPGEGRLHVRLCPAFKNTPESIGTIVAVHQETKSRHMVHLATETPDLGYQSVFSFYSLPLGTYDVTCTYGIQVRGIPDVSKMKCDKEAKPCRDELIREMQVVLPADEAPPEMDDKGKPKMKPCDFQAE